MGFGLSTLSNFIAGLAVLVVGPLIFWVWRAWRLSQTADPTTQIIVVENFKKQKVRITKQEVWHNVRLDLQQLLRFYCALLAWTVCITDLASPFWVPNRSTDAIGWLIMAATFTVIVWAFSSEPELRGNPTLSTQQRKFARFYWRCVPFLIGAIGFVLFGHGIYFDPEMEASRQKVLQLEQRIVDIDREGEIAHKKLVERRDDLQRQYDQLKKRLEWEASNQPTTRP